MSRRIPAMPGRLALTVAVAGLLLPAADRAAAQTSIYGIRGLGYPGRIASARERGLGSGSIAFNPGAPVNPAAVAGFTGITVEIMGETDLRSYTIDGLEVGGLNATRFPLGQLGGRFGSSPLSFAVSFAQYMDRSYDLTLNDTLRLRGEDVAYQERTTSQGGMTDVRGALAWRFSPRVWVGAGLHVLTGSAKLTFLRSFADSAYRPYRIETEESSQGFGVSAGAVVVPVTGVVVGVAVRTDTRADVQVDSVQAADVDLPTSVVAGMRVSALRAIRWTASAVWRSWSGANGDLSARAFDTWEVGTGFEIGGPEVGSRFPFRVGFRYATLPFSPTDDQPREVGVSAGTGMVFAGGRGVVDAALERARRTGAGGAETAWQLSWTVTIRP